MTNLSTLVIYGALYVSLTVPGIFLIGTLATTSRRRASRGSLVPAAGAVLDAVRKLAARHGPRLFMTIGPAIMGLGLLWLARIPSDSAPWILGGGTGSRFLPPGDYFVDILPALLVFGTGLTIMVAPLTTALMTSVLRATRAWPRRSTTRSPGWAPRSSPL